MKKNKNQKQKLDFKSILLIILKYIIIFSIIIGIGFLVYNGRRIISYGQLEVARYEASQNKPYDSIATYLYSLKMYNNNPQSYIELYNMYNIVNDKDSGLLVLEAGYNQTKSEEIKYLLDNYLNNKQKENEILKKDELENDDIIARMTVTYSDGNQEISSYSYNDKGKLISSSTTDGNGIFIGREEYIYSDLDELEGTEEYRLRYTKYYEYDDNGNLIKLSEESINDNGVDTDFYMDNSFNVFTNEDFDYSIEYVYDDYGTISDIKASDSDEDYEISISYDKKNHYRTKSSAKKNSDLLSTKEAQYDANGNLIKDILTYEQESRKTFNYSYNEEGMIESINIVVEGYDPETRRFEPVIMPYYDMLYSEENTIYVYDDNGSIKAEMNYYDSKFVSSIKYDYDNNGNILKESFYEPANLNNSYVTEYIYDDKNQLVNILKEYMSGGNKEIDILNYDEKGNCISDLYRNDNDNSEIKDCYYTYIYDDNNRVKEENVYYIVMNKRHNEKEIDDEKGKSVWYTVNDSMGNIIENGFEEYDKNGRLNAETIFDTSNGNFLERTEYLYDKKGNIAAKITIDSDGTFKSYIGYKYDEKNVLISEVESVKVTTTYSHNYNTDYSYYANGKIETKTKKEDDGNSYLWKYYYDDKDRLSKCEYSSTDKNGKYNLLETTVYEY